MNLATFEAAGERRIGVVADLTATVLDLAAAHKTIHGCPCVVDMLSLIDAGPQQLALAREMLETALEAAPRSLGEVRLLASLVKPRQILNSRRVPE